MFQVRFHGRGGQGVVTAAKKGNTYLGGVLGETAISAGRTQTREGARYRKLARSRGTAKACVAVGNTQLKVYHKLLSNPGMRYEDLGPDYYERRAATRRKVTWHMRQIEAEGFDVTITPREPGSAQDAHASGGAA